MYHITNLYDVTDKLKYTTKHIGILILDYSSLKKFHIFFFLVTVFKKKIRQTLL